MSLFQKIIVNRHLKNLNIEKAQQAFDMYKQYFSDKIRLTNIMLLKEENYQEGFLRELFVEVLGYTINPNENYNLTTEFKNQTDNRKADGAILKNNEAIGVIELKSTKVIDLKYITDQAFSYKNNQPNCLYVITSNFHFLRFYIENAVNYEEFDLFDLDFDDFKRLYLFLCKESIFADLPLKLQEETKFHEETITEKFYRDYKRFKDNIFESVSLRNPHFDEVTLLKKSQKLLDRVIFVAFAEDKGLIPPNALSRTIDKWKLFVNEGEEMPLYSRYQKLFNHFNIGFVYKDWGRIPAYNGGLFFHDDILDNPNFIIDNDILEKGVLSIAKYDFATEIDVNILGHVFEHSLNELDEIQKNNESGTRKKFGIFYTPDFITQYICENTIGRICADKKTELNFDNTKNKKEFVEKLKLYKNWLFEIKILDPACGSGAFLVAALNFLIKEHKQIEELLFQATGKKQHFPDTDKMILEKNIFGVDINEESVDITKLSLWLQTAKIDRKLSYLSENIKCGNSLIDNSEIALEKAFLWENEFSDIFKNGGFDVIVGNPPYVDSENMTKHFPAMREEISKTYKTAKGNWDLYIPFVERGFNLLKENSYLSLIIPNKWLSMPYGSALREYIFDYIFQLSDFQKLKVFESDIFPVTFAMKKAKSGIIDIKIFNETPKTFRNFTILKNSENWADNWGFLLSEQNLILTKIKNVPYTLNKIAEIHGAFTTSEAYLLPSILQLFQGNEKNTFLKFVNTGIIDKFINLWDFEKVTYLKKKYFRPVVEIGEFKQKFPKRFEKFDKPKIIISGIRHFESFFDKNSEYLAGKSTTVLTNLKLFNYETILCILNSSLMKFFVKESFGTSGMDGGINFSPNLIRSLPIPDINSDFQSKFENFYNELIPELQIFFKLKRNFAKVFVTDFEVEHFSKKLHNWENLEWEKFVHEIKKQKGKSNKKKQLEWVDFFNENKDKILNYKSKINKILLLIDELVYDLYKLTDEEINVVEGK